MYEIFCENFSFMSVCHEINSHEPEVLLVSRDNLVKQTVLMLKRILITLNGCQVYTCLEVKVSLRNKINDPYNNVGFQNPYVKYKDRLSITSHVRYSEYSQTKLICGLF